MSSSLSSSALAEGFLWTSVSLSHKRINLHISRQSQLWTWASETLQSGIFVWFFVLVGNLESYRVKSVLMGFWVGYFKHSFSWFTKAQRALLTSATQTSFFSLMKYNIPLHYIIYLMYQKVLIPLAPRQPPQRVGENRFVMEIIGMYLLNQESREQ